MKIQLAFFFDQARCMACSSCSVSCKDSNDVNPGLVHWRKQFTHEHDNNFFPLSMACNHCEDPACLKACPIGAIYKDDRGIVLIDRNKCEGLGDCTVACPYEVPQFADDRQEPVKKEGWQIEHPVQKCTMCVERVEQGEVPVCVKSCIGRAMDFGTVEYIMKKYPDAVRMNREDFPYAYRNDEQDTTPSFFIRKRSPLKIHKSSKYKG